MKRAPMCNGSALRKAMNGGPTDGLGQLCSRLRESDRKPISSWISALSVDESGEGYFVDLWAISEGGLQDILGRH